MDRALSCNTRISMRAGVQSNGFLSVTVSMPVRRRRLESDESPALRTPSAGLLQFAKAFCEPEKDLPPPAANVKEFRAQARPQPSQGNRRLSDLPVGFRNEHSSPNSPAGPDKAPPSSRLQKAVSNFNRPASGSHRESALPDSSRRRLIGTKTVTDKNPRLLKPKLTNKLTMN